MKRRLIVWLWENLPLEDREAFVGNWITNRARRRAALGPFPKAFEDEMNDAAVAMVRDFNRSYYG